LDFATVLRGLRSFTESLDRTLERRLGEERRGEERRGAERRGEERRGEERSSENLRVSLFSFLSEALSEVSDLSDLSDLSEFLSEFRAVAGLSLSRELCIVFPSRDENIEPFLFWSLVSVDGYFAEAWSWWRWSWSWSWSWSCGAGGGGGGRVG
jgi:hypothetical protein